MRRNLEVPLKRLIAALEELGYHRINRHRLEWRRKRFHAILVPRGRFVTLYLHVDVPVYVTPLIVHHTTRKTGRDIAKEYKKIMEILAYSNPTVR